LATRAVVTGMGVSSGNPIRLVAGLRARPIRIPMTSLVVILSAVALAIGIGAGYNEGRHRVADLQSLAQ
jgi:hypothetical protein